MDASTNPQQPPARKPCIALMGEFSAGKSTLTNLLVGEPILPVQVTATQLPPVWITSGKHEPYRLDIDGDEHAVDLNDVGVIDLEQTQYIRVGKQADILEFCDIIDMPGISDPNMSADVWERVLHNADAVVWCTHATQAWRQSEAAVWDTIPTDIQQRSLLLLTRFDKIQSANDRRRVLRRVAKEIDGLFADLFPISLLNALNAGEDRAAWEQSGAEAFVGALVDLLHELGQLKNKPVTQAASAGPAKATQAGFADAVARVQRSQRDAEDAARAVELARVTPRRVRRAAVGE